VGLGKVGVEDVRSIRDGWEHIGGTKKDRSAAFLSKIVRPGTSCSLSISRPNPVPAHNLRKKYLVRAIYPAIFLFKCSGRFPFIAVIIVEYSPQH
jgi:hypothetical protein